MTLDSKITAIIDEELDFVKDRIVKRIERLLSNQDEGGTTPLVHSAPVDQPKSPMEGSSYAGTPEMPSRAFPNPEKYQMALEIYQEEKNHSRVARELGITVNAAKKYYTWFVKNGYLPSEKAELSDAEQKVVHCIFEKGMSLTAAAKELQCSVTNIRTRRDSAISKGYVPPAREENSALFLDSGDREG